MASQPSQRTGHSLSIAALRTELYFNLSASAISNNFLTNSYLDSQEITPQSLNSS